MTLVDCGNEILVEVSLQTENVTFFVGVNHSPPPNFTCTCSGHYLLTMSVTPRPQEARARLGDGEVLPETAMGELMLIPPGYAQHGRFKPQFGWRRDLYCLFPQRHFETWTGRPIEWTRAALCAAVDVRDANIHNAMRRLAQEAFSQGMASSVLIDSIATTVAVDLCRYFDNRSKAEPSGPLLTPRQLKLIRDFIYAYSEQDLRLSDFADICGLSVRHLTRAFKRTTGLTVASHVTEIRLEIAKQLLRDTNLPAKVIAARIGFSNVSSFASAFRKLTGVTPRTFRGHEMTWCGDETKPVAQKPGRRSGRYLAH